MHLTATTIRTVVILLTGFGMVLPSNAVSPCRCAKRDDCCTRQAEPTRACCSTRESCCADKTDSDIELACSGAKACAYCPCCSEPAPPAIPSAQSTIALSDHDFSIAIAPLLAAAPAPVDLQLSYVLHERGSPSGYPALRLHELKCVWLN